MGEIGMGLSRCSIGSGEGSVCGLLGGGVVEGDPEESLQVQPVLRLPLPVVAYDAEEFGEYVREAAIIRSHVGCFFDEELSLP